MAGSRALRLRSATDSLVMLRKPNAESRMTAVRVGPLEAELGLPLSSRDLTRLSGDQMFIRLCRYFVSKPALPCSEGRLMTPPSSHTIRGSWTRIGFLQESGRYSDCSRRRSPLELNVLKDRGAVTSARSNNSGWLQTCGVVRVSSSCYSVFSYENSLLTFLNCITTFMRAFLRVETSELSLA
jgi:hypothetical protein